MDNKNKSLIADLLGSATGILVRAYRKIASGNVKGIDVARAISETRDHVYEAFMLGAHLDNFTPWFKWVLSITDEITDMAKNHKNDDGRIDVDAEGIHIERAPSIYFENRRKFAEFLAEHDLLNGEVPFSKTFVPPTYQP